MPKVKWVFAEKTRGETDDIRRAKRTVEAWARGEPQQAVKAESYVYTDQFKEKLVAVLRGNALVLSWQLETRSSI